MRLPGRLLFFGSLLAQIHCEDVYGIMGENFTFPVKIDRKIVEITWTRNKDKVAEWEGENETTYYTSLRNRGLLNKENGRLTIYNLESSDAGTYMLHYLHTVEENYNLTFALYVLDPPSEPEISCNISGDIFVLKCAAHFQEPLDYTWKFSTIQATYQNQEIIIPKKSVDASETATCFIKFSQTEKSSEISLTQCFPEETGGSRHERSRVALIAAFGVFIAIVVILVFLYKRDYCATSRHISRKDFCVSAAVSSQVVEYEDEKPEADKELNKEDSAQKDKQTVNNGVNQEELSAMQSSSLTSNCAVDHDVTEGDIFKEENSSLLSKHAVDHGVNEGEVIQDVGGGNGEHLDNSHSCSEEDLRS